MKKTLLSMTLLLLANVATQAQAPNISYNSPQTYTVGTTISPLLPINTGGTVPGTYGQVTTFVGNGQEGIVNGNGSTASFALPCGVALDKNGNLFVADALNNMIRKVTSAGIVSTFAGKVQAGQSDGTGASASFYMPMGVAVDNSGNVYVADTYNNRIRKITPAGAVTTLAGNGQEAFIDGAGSAASFSNPQGIAVDLSGNVFVADTQNYRIRKITSIGVVTTFAGSGQSNVTDGTGVNAGFGNPLGITVDLSGNLYVVDGSQIRKITPAGVVTTIAGGSEGYADGVGTAAKFSTYSSIATDANGDIYITDISNNRIRKISPSGAVTTIAGNGQRLCTDGIGNAASFSDLMGVSTDASGGLYITDDKRIRKISTYGYSISPNLPAGLNFDNATGIINGIPLATIPATTYTVTASSANGICNATIIIATKDDVKPSISYSKSLNYQVGTAITPLNLINTGGKIPLQLKQVITLAGSGQSGSTDGGSLSASFSSPQGVAIDTKGNVYVADTSNNKIRKITADGVVTTLAGSGLSGYKDGKGVLANFSGPSGIAVDLAENVYVADTYNNRIRKISSDGTVITIAGNGQTVLKDGLGTAASFNGLNGLALDVSGNIFVADTFNHSIRKITPAGQVTTVAGSGQLDWADGSGSEAKFFWPANLTIDSFGNIFVADNGNRVIRKITPNGTVTTIAGSVQNSGLVDGFDSDARFNQPRGITSDLKGNLYVADTWNNRIREINSEGSVKTFAGNGQNGAADNNVNNSSFDRPVGITADAKGDLYIADTWSNKIRKIIVNSCFITPALPNGLSFNASTGTISGTATVAAPLTTYTVTACNSGGCASTTVNIGSSALGLNDFSKESISVYPNPVNSILQIQTPDNVVLEKIQMIDLTGKVVLEKTGNTSSVDVQKLANGVYILKAETLDKTYNTKFIKN